MFEGLQEDQLAGAIEALLFVSDEPVSAVTLADMLEVDLVKVEQAVSALKESLAGDGRGIEIREVAGGWRLYTKPIYHELLNEYVLSWDTRKLSQAALETLAIVAYTQPVTRASIVAIRGVISDSPIASLIEKGLIREAGTMNAPGNPILYTTTRTFLEKFGLASINDLPPLEQFAADEETRAFINERLSIAHYEGATEPEQALDNLESINIQQSLADALAAQLGLVEKIDFGSLVFETDDE
ncbi:MAG: SMC-Scp complex subunit ScpB [Eggerthellaceae bacterium]|nr:SMC-Scp complex subunit ScpB [Eggerthellaceae bacterium]